MQDNLYDKNLFAYCDNNPVVRKDTTGAVWETVFDIVSLASSVADVIANPANPWAWAALVGDVVDVAVPFVTGVGEVTKVARTTVELISDVDNVIDTAKAVKNTTEVASDVKKSTGVYVVLYENGKNYVGKGGLNRAITSAKNHLLDGDVVSAIIWAPTSTAQKGFIAEYLLQTVRPVGKYNLSTFNKIWSPGRNMY